MSFIDKGLHFQSLNSILQAHCELVVVGDGSMKARIRAILYRNWIDEELEVHAEALAEELGVSSHSLGVQGNIFKLLRDCFGEDLAN